jgi:hypothetical protein
MPTGLDVSGTNDPFPHLFGVFSLGAAAQGAHLHGRHVDVQVDAVEQGAGELRAIGVNAVLPTLASTAGISGVPTRTRIDRRDQQGLSGEGSPHASSRNRQHAIFQGLSQGLDRAATKLRQFV